MVVMDVSLVILLEEAVVAQQQQEVLEVHLLQLMQVE